MSITDESGISPKASVFDGIGVQYTGSFGYGIGKEQITDGSWSPTSLAVGGRTIAIYLATYSYTDLAGTVAAVVNDPVRSMYDRAGGGRIITQSNDANRPVRTEYAGVKFGFFDDVAHRFVRIFSSSVAATDCKFIAVAATPSGSSSTNPTVASNMITAGSVGTFALQVAANGTDWRCLVRNTASVVAGALPQKQRVVLEQTSASAAYLQINAGTKNSVSVGADANALTTHAVGGSASNQSTIIIHACVQGWGGSALTDAELASLNTWLSQQ